MSARERGTRRERLGFVLLVCALFAAAAWTAAGFPVRARLFPQTVALAGLVLGIVEAVRTWRPRAERRDAGGGIEPGLTSAAEGVGFLGHARRALPYLLWLAAYYAAIWATGLVVASGLFLAGFLRREAGLTWWRALSSAATMCAFLLALAAFARLEWPLPFWMSG